MGYACPVCDDPQADGEHLANHLAFTAMLGDDDHAAWLDDHVTAWGDCDPAALAERVTDHAEVVEFPQVFEDTTGDDTSGHGHGQGHEGGHDHGHDHSGASDLAGGSTPTAGDVGALGGDDVDPESVYAEAAEMTRRRRANASVANDGDGEDAGEAETDETDGSSDERGS